MITRCISDTLLQYVIISFIFGIKKTRADKYIRDSYRVANQAVQNKYFKEDLHPNLDLWPMCLTPEPLVGAFLLPRHPIGLKTILRNGDSDPGRLITSSRVRSHPASMLCATIFWITSSSSGSLLIVEVVAQGTSAIMLRVGS
jgi:hypothetical protein